MGKYLSNTIGAAAFGAASLLNVVANKEGSFGHCGAIEFREPDGKPRFVHCRTEILGRELADELGRWYFPGGIAIDYIQQKSGAWLVCFRATSILAAAYMRLTAEEMSKLLAGLEGLM